MKRLLANSILMASGIVLSSQLYALGLGELTLDSALNQPLKATIELTDLDGLTEWDIKPSLASQADFERAGVDRDFFLSSIQFKIENNQIKLSTRDAVNEPFLNFILEVNWPAGRLLREYTVLLDPPTFAEQNYQPLVIAPQSTEVIEEVEIQEAVRPALVNQWDEPAASGTYKVQPNDTLWAIALETRPNSGISPQQMMLALQQENPEAFIGGNINRLKSHYVLNVPEEERIRAITQQQAIAEVARQNQALQAGVAQVDATGLNRQGAGKPSSTEGGEVRLVTPTAAESNTLSAGGDATGEGQGSRQELENDLAIALENVDKGARENQELQDRLASLEEQISTLESLIALKDDQLANLQLGQVSSETEQAVASEENIDFNYAANEQGSEPSNEQELDESESELTAEEQAAAQLAQEQQAEQEAEERRARIAALMAEQEAAAAETSIVDELLKDPLIPVAGGAVLLLLSLLGLRALRNRKAKPEEEQDFALADDEMLQDLDSDSDSLDEFDFDLNDNEHSAAADDWNGDSFDEQEEPSEAVAQTDDALSEAEIYIAFGKFAQAAALLNGAIEAESERTDLRLKLLEVLAESDDAEGFYAAEQALAKLADADADAEAGRLRERLSDPIITPSALGDEVDDFADLENELAQELSDGLDFEAALDLEDSQASSETVVSLMPEAEIEASSALELDDTEVEIPTLDDSLNSADNVEEAAEEDSLDFDVDSFALDSELEEDVLDIAATDSDDDALDFDFDLASEQEVPSLEEPAETAATELADEAEAELEFSTDLELDLEDDLSSSLEEDTAEAIELDSDDFADLEFEVDTDTAEQQEQELENSLEDLEVLLDGEESAGDDSLEFEDLDLDFDINAPAADDSADQADFATSATPATEAPSNASDEINLDELAAAEDEFAFLSGTDECATKLDLARAYIDMEDSEGAKELLQEVLQEGSEAQQAEARELISNL